MCGSNDNDNGPKSFHGMAGPKPGDRRPGESARDFYDRQTDNRGRRGIFKWAVRLLPPRRPRLA